MAVTTLSLHHHLYHGVDRVVNLILNHVFVRRNCDEAAGL